MVDDTSQRSVATWFRCGGTFDHCFITNLLLSLFWHIFFKKSLNIWKSHRERYSSDNTIDTLACSFHWLRAPERIKFKLAVIVYRAVHDTAPRYLSDVLHNVTDLPTRSRLRSSTSRLLDVRPSRLVTVGDHWPLIMAALSNRTGHYIFVLCFLSSFFFFVLSFFFLA